MPSGTVTFLFTDIAGSTKLWETAPDGMRAALERHDSLMRAAFESHGGYVFATGGDGFGVSFARADDAVAAAVEAQHALDAQAWPDGAALRVRMGAHTGSASERDGDYFGPPVNRAARLMAVAHGGQVVCSQTTASLVGDALPLVALGEHRLRDLTSAETVFQVGEGAFPPLRSVDVVPTNLPTVRTELIGRSEDLEAIAPLVTGERLVTLTGVGGVGKTRLALGAAASAAAGFADGCWFVELSPVTDGDDVGKAVAAAMGVSLTSDALVDYLVERRMLIVLDNCEHVLDAVADLVDAILVSAADVHVIATSREPLGLDGEQVRRVPSLLLPDAHGSLSDAGSAAAVRLFADRAAAASEGFRVDEGNVAAVVEICRRLDGIPLALELAAARVRAMSPSEIAGRLDERFRLLAGGSRRTQERHRTLLATVSWSHDLLDDDERVVFRRLSVFPGTFDLAAAEAVVGDDVDAVGGVVGLVDRSLVVHEAGRDRYRLLETLRQFGNDRLADAAEADLVRRRHAEWFLGLAEQSAPGLFGPEYGATIEALELELDNLRATAEWCADTEQWSDLAGLSFAIYPFLFQVAPVDLRAWNEQILERRSETEPQLAADCVGQFAFAMSVLFGEHDRAQQLAEISIGLSDSSHVAPSQFAWLAMTAWAGYRGQLDDSIGFSETAETVAESRRDERSASSAVLFRMAALAFLGQTEPADSLVDGELRRASDSGDSTVQSSVVMSVAMYHLRPPDPDFGATLDFLTGHPTDAPAEHVNGLWLDLMWGLTLLGLGRPDAIGHVARATRTADRVNALGMLDFALRQVAVIAAQHECPEKAALLVAYTDSVLSPHRLLVPVLQLVQDWLDQAGVGVDSPPSPDPTPRRPDVMAIVEEIESDVASQTAL